MALNIIIYDTKSRRKMELIILSNIRYEQLLNNLINSLLSLSNEKENEILTLTANCLGELGAIDFVSLHKNQHYNKKKTDDNDNDDDDDEEEDSDLEIVNQEINDSETKTLKDIPKCINDINEFSLYLIENYLIPIHISSNNPTTQNQSQYALQELLKVLECDENTPNKPNKHWKQFNDDIQQILIPCLRTTFDRKREDTISNNNNNNDNDIKMSDNKTMKNHLSNIFIKIRKN